MSATLPPVPSVQDDHARPHGQFRLIAAGIIAFFFVVYAGALSIQYVEGDDSRSVIYALLGVDNSYYNPMPYHSMASKLLAMLPKQEPLVRHVAICGSALCAIAFLILLTRLVWHWGRELGLQEKVMVPFMIATPIIMPEFLFLGLVYEPLLIAMTMILVAHLIARPVFTKSANGRSECISRLVVAALLFGFGVSFRWDAGFYGSVIFVDCVLAGWRHPERVRMTAQAIAWGCGAILATVGALALSGYPPSAIIETLQWAKTTIAEGTPLSLKIFYGVATLTPASIILLALGIVAAVRIKSGRVLLLTLAGSPMFMLLGIIAFWIKSVITVVPALLLVMLMGAHTLQRFYQTKSCSTQRIMIAACIIITSVPWLIGLQWPGRLASRGPGFELTTSPSPTRSEAPQVVFDSGLAVPTPEGPRPLWGFGHVLFGGDWRQYVRTMNERWNVSIDDAAERGIAIHQDTNTGFVLARLHSLGYELTTARVPITSPQVPHGSHHRILRHTETGKEVEIILFSGLDKRLQEKGAIGNALAVLGHGEVAVIYVSPSRFLSLFENNLATVEEQGALTGTWMNSNPENPTQRSESSINRPTAP